MEVTTQWFGSKSDFSLVVLVVNEERPRVEEMTEDDAFLGYTQEERGMKKAPVSIFYELS